VLIAAGPEESLYSVFAEELAEYLGNNVEGTYTFDIIRTDGSIENITRLPIEPNVMLALVQEDVARFYYTGQGNEFFPHDRREDYRVTFLSRLFYENFYFVVRSGITEPEDLKAVHVGQRESGSYATYTTLRAGYRPTWAEHYDGNPIQMLREGQIDGFVEVEATPNQQLFSLARQGLEFDLLPVNRRRLTLGLDVYGAVVLPDSLSPTRRPVETISVPALLLCKRELPQEIADAVLKALCDPTAIDRHFPRSKRYLEEIPRTLKPNKATPEASDLRFSQPPLPPHPEVVHLLVGDGWELYGDFLSFAGIFSLAFLLWCALPLLPQTRERFRRRFLPSGGRRTLYWGLFAVLLYFCVVSWGAFGIKARELGVLLKGHVLAGSSFVEWNLLQTLKWLFIFLVTEETNDVFPNSSFAQLVVVIIKIGMIGVVGFLGYRFLGALVDELKRNRKMSPEHWNGHVVICNWNSRVPRLIRYLRAEGVPENRRNRPIVVVSASAEAVKESEKSKTIHVVQSRAWDPSGLKEAGIARADSAILMGPEDPELDADATVLRTALAINTFLNNDPEFKKRRTLISVCAELQSEQSHEYIKDLGVTEVVVSEHVGMHLLAQAVLCPGTSFFFNEIFDSAPESNEFYSPDVPFKKHGEPVSFREILEHYRDTTFKDRPVLPLGLRLFKDRSDQSEKGPEVTSRSFTYASRRKILVNPTEEEIKKEGFENFVSRDEVLVISDTDPQDIAQGGGR